LRASTLLRRGPESGPGGTPLIRHSRLLQELLRRGPESGPGGWFCAFCAVVTTRFYGEVPSRDLVVRSRRNFRTSHSSLLRRGPESGPGGLLAYTALDYFSGLLRRGPESGPGGLAAISVTAR